MEEDEEKKKAMWKMGRDLGHMQYICSLTFWEPRQEDHEVSDRLGSLTKALW